MYRCIYQFTTAVCLLINLLFVASGEARAADRIITAVAGGGAFQANHGDNGPATSAYLWPAGVTCDSAGNMYIADFQYNSIRKVTVSTGIITTIAGTGAFGSSGDGGLATQATLSFPARVAVDAGGNVYVADTYSGRIRKIDAGTSVITTICPGSSSLCLDGAGNLFFSSGNQIKKINLASSAITIVAGNGVMAYSGDGGQALSAGLSNHIDMCVSPTGDLYIADSYFSVVRKVTAATGIIATIAGVGTSGYGGWRLGHRRDPIVARIRAVGQAGELLHLRPEEFQDSPDRFSIRNNHHHRRKWRLWHHRLRRSCN